MKATRQEKENLSLKLKGRFSGIAYQAGVVDCQTLPPISPVAWSTFQTGVNPGKHNIFDFLVPDERTYQPKLSSVEIRTLHGVGYQLR